VTGLVASTLDLKKETAGDAGELWFSRGIMSVEAPFSADPNIGARH
jgi:hypothetical protein